MSCCCVPFAMLVFVGVTAMDKSVAAVTERVVAPDTLPSVALMAVLPIATLVARPLLPAALDTAATEGFVEDQVAVAVRS